MSRDASRSSAGARPQSPLFCTHCGHESSVDGDWRVRAAADRLACDCPVCGETITERAAESAETPPVSGPPTPAAVGSLFARSVRLAIAWAAWPYTLGECSFQ